MVKWSHLPSEKVSEFYPSPTIAPTHILRCVCAVWKELVALLNKLMSKVLWLLILIDDCAPVWAHQSLKAPIHERQRRANKAKVNHLGRAWYWSGRHPGCPGKSPFPIPFHSLARTMSRRAGAPLRVCIEITHK